MGPHIPVNVGNVLLIGAVAVGSIMATIAILKIVQRTPARTLADGGLHLLGVPQAA